MTDNALPQITEQDVDVAHNVFVESRVGFIHRDVLWNALRAVRNSLARRIVEPASSPDRTTGECGCAEHVTPKECKAACRCACNADFVRVERWECRIACGALLKREDTDKHNCAPNACACVAAEERRRLAAPSDARPAREVEALEFLDSRFGVNYSEAYGAWKVAIDPGAAFSTIADAVRQVLKLEREP